MAQSVDLNHKVKRLIVDPTNPFKDDKAGRQNSAKLLTQYVRTIRVPYVLAIEGAWGVGKSTFIDMWLADLAISKIPTVRFNAWEADYHDDPLAALISELSNSIAQLAKNGAISDSAKADALMTRAKGFGLKLGKRIIPAAVKIATAGVLNISDITIDGIEDAAEKASEAILKAYDEKKQSVVGFRDAIAECAKALGEKGGGVPLIFVIDELDRCRPNFALEILERVKHLFNVEGVVFVLAVDLEQLSNALNGVYGSLFSSRAYLKRFIDIEYSLPQPDLQSFSAQTMTSLGFDDLISKITGDANAPAYFSIIFGQLAVNFKMGLRDVEQAISQINVLLRTLDGRNVDVILLPLMVALRFAKNDEYKELVGGSIGVQEILALISSGENGITFLSSNEGGLLEGVLFSETASAAEIAARVAAADAVPAGSRTNATDAIQRFLHRQTPNRRREIKDIHQRLQMVREFKI